MMKIDYFWQMHKNACTHIHLVCIVALKPNSWCRFQFSFQLSVKLSLSRSLSLSLCLSCLLTFWYKNNIYALNHYVTVTHINNNFFFFKFRFTAQSLTIQCCCYICRSCISSNSSEMCMINRASRQCIYTDTHIGRTYYSKEMSSMKRRRKMKRRRERKRIAIYESDIQINSIEHLSYRKYTHIHTTSTAVKINLEMTTMNASHLIIMLLFACIWIWFAWKKK